MGETTTRSWGRISKGPKVVGANDKDLAQGILILPMIARSAILQAARDLGSEGLLLLLTKYYLSPAQISNLRIEEGSLRIHDSGDVVDISAGDWDVVQAWLQQKGRSSTQKAIRDHLGRSIQRRAREILADLETPAASTSWRMYLTVGVRDLRRWAREELAFACDYDEGVYRELLHDETADVDDTFRFLTVRARVVLSRVADKEVSGIRAIQRRHSTPSGLIDQATYQPEVEQ
ncbi:MAG: hypothetical protein HKL82_06955 [Acidimicrobiaceae bacterium]|nr:hypothetical protein [Acidimicrobiaceae bacterium]